MAKEVFLPKTGMEMQEGRIVRWYAKVGDNVRKGDPLLAIETDKITMDVESPCDGTLLCHYFDEGVVVPVATILAYIGNEGEEIPDQPRKAGGAAREAEEAALTAPMTPTIRDYDYDVAVIGGGPAGVTAALRASRQGAATVLFEKQEIGGVSMNEGSLPMKTYLFAARSLDEVRRSAEKGVCIKGEVRFDLETLHAYKEKVVGRMRIEKEELLSRSGVTVIEEEAALIAPHTIRCGKRTVTASSILLCGGSVVKELHVEGEDLPGVLTAEEVFSMTSLPKELLIVGGGVIGCEIACAFHRFGSEVTIVEEQEVLVPTFDEDVSRTLREIFEKEGIRVITGGKIGSFYEEGDKTCLLLKDGNRLSADVILLSVGRRPDESCLGELAGQIERERGKIMVDDQCRTSIPGIFACGDLTNRSIVAHSAIRMGEVAAHNACGNEKVLNLNRAPLCLFTIPEAAGIGLTEREAKRSGDIMIGTYPFIGNERAVASGETEGFVKVIADRGYGEILGVHIVGPNASEMIVEAKTMMDMEITVYEVADIVHPHPTCSEAFMLACADAIGECLEIPPRLYGAD